MPEVYEEYLNVVEAPSPTEILSASGIVFLFVYRRRYFFVSSAFSSFLFQSDSNMGWSTNRHSQIWLGSPRNILKFGRDFPHNILRAVERGSFPQYFNLISFGGQYATKITNYHCQIRSDFPHNILIPVKFDWDSPTIFLTQSNLTGVSPQYFNRI